MTSLPELPAGLKELDCSYMSLVLQREKGETIADYKLRWNEWRDEQASKQRVQSKTRLLKEELIMEVYNPKRAEKVLDTYGYEVFDRWLGGY